MAVNARGTLRRTRLIRPGGGGGFVGGRSADPAGATEVATTTAESLANCARLHQRGPRPGAHGRDSAGTVRAGGLRDFQRRFQLFRGTRNGPGKREGAFPAPFSPTPRPPGRPAARPPGLPESRPPGVPPTPALPRCGATVVRLPLRRVERVARSLPSPPRPTAGGGPYGASTIRILHSPILDWARSSGRVAGARTLSLLSTFTHLWRYLVSASVTSDDPRPPFNPSH